MRWRLNMAAGLGVALCLSGATSATEQVGGLTVERVGPAAPLVLSAVEETGCRVPVLVLRCREGAVELLYSFDMETDAARPPRVTMAVDGAALALPEVWPLSPNGRGVRIPAAALQPLAAGRAVDFVLRDPASGAELRDGFLLEGVAAALDAMPCAAPLRGAE